MLSETIQSSHSQRLEISLRFKSVKFSVQFEKLTGFLAELVTNQWPIVFQHVIHCKVEAPFDCLFELDR